DDSADALIGAGEFEPLPEVGALHRVEFVEQRPGELSRSTELPLCAEIGPVETHPGQSHRGIPRAPAIRRPTTAYPFGIPREGTDYNGDCPLCKTRRETSARGGGVRAVALREAFWPDGCSRC